MARVDIAHLTITIREVEIDEECPQCKADLTERSALKAWQYNDASWPAHLGAPDPTWDDVEGGVAIERDPGSEAGSAWLPTVAYYCAHCGHQLAEGDVAPG